MMAHRTDANPFDTALALAFKMVVNMSELDAVYQTEDRAESAYPFPWSEADYREFVGIGGTTRAWRITERALRRAGITNLAAMRVGAGNGTVDPFEKARAVWALCPIAERGAALQVWVRDHLRGEASRWFWQLFTREDAIDLFAEGMWPSWMPPHGAMPSGAAVPASRGRRCSDGRAWCDD